MRTTYLVSVDHPDTAWMPESRIIEAIRNGDEDFSFDGIYPMTVVLIARAGSED